MKSNSFFFKQKDSSENLLATTKNLLYYLSIKFSEQNLMDRLFLHPKYPAMIALEDSLYDYKIENISVELDNDDLDEIEQLPGIFHLKKDAREYFVTVHEITNDKVRYIDPALGWQTETREDFAKKWSGKVNLSATNVLSQEAAFDSNRKETIQAKIQKTSLFVCLLVFGFCLSTYLLTTIAEIDLSWLLLFAFKMLGSLICILLITKELGSNNQFLDKICRPMGIEGNSFNCAGILNSNAAKIFSWLSLAEVGLFYFLGGALTLLFSLINHSFPAIEFVFGIVAIAALPFTLYSIYYQAVKIKIWCTLCLFIQIVIWAEFLVLLAFGNWVFLPITLENIYAILLGFTLPIGSWFVIRPFFNAAKNEKKFRKRLRIFEANNEVFKALLHESQTANDFTPNYEMTFGEPDAPNTFILTISAHCGHCGNALKEIFGLLIARPGIMKLIVRLKISRTPDTTDWAKHILQYRKQMGEDESIELLLQWYKIYDVESWVKTYPLSFDHPGVDDLDAQILGQQEWVVRQNIGATPDIIVNDKMLPQEFSYDDLKYFIISDFE